MPSDFDQAGWMMNHTSLLNQQHQRREQQGYGVLSGRRNSYNLQGGSAVLAVKPYLAARRKDEATVMDVKSRYFSLPE